MLFLIEQAARRIRAPLGLQGPNYAAPLLKLQGFFKGDSPLHDGFSQLQLAENAFPVRPIVLLWLL